MTSAEQLKPEYWNGHSIADSCEPRGFLPGLYGVFSKFPEQRDMILRALQDSRLVSEMTTQGQSINLQDLPMGTVLRYETESLHIGRKTDIAKTLQSAFTFGLIDPEMEWDRPYYFNSTTYGVVTKIDRFREPPITGLVTFPNLFLVNKLFNGDTRSTPLNIGQVSHSKLMDKLQTQDRHLISRVTKVGVFG